MRFLDDAVVSDPAAAQLPPLPEVVEPDRLQALSEPDLDGVEQELRGAERATQAAMSPWDRQLREIRARLAEVSTERRRRERAAHVAQRASVRELAKAGTMPTLADGLAAPDELFEATTALASLRVFLKSGGEVGLGFATRPGTIAFTDGRRQQQAKTWGEARELVAAGWEPGSAGIPGIRVHLAGSRVERVVGADEVVVEPRAV